MLKFCFLSYISLIVFAAGMVAITFLTPFIHDKIKQDFSLADPTTKFYANFVNQSKHVSVYKIFTFYNITNLPGVVNRSEYPIVNPMGPYYYERVRVRTESDISWQPNGTIHYRWSETYKFHPELSKGSESDMVTTARLGPMFALQTVSAANFPQIGKDLFADKAGGVGSLFVTKSVSDLVRGYKDPFLVEMLLPDPYVGVAPAEYNVSYSECYNGGKPSTSQPDTPDRAFGKMTMWKGNRDLKGFWTTNETQVLRGTDGSTFAPFLDDVEEIVAFVEALRRPVVLSYDRDVDVEGVYGTTRRYKPRYDQFNDYNATPYNKGYRIFQQGFQPRPPVIGVEDGYILGAISKQHYLDCKGPYLHVDIGKADPELDETHLEFEPITATLVRVRKRSMLNIMLKPLWYQDLFSFPQTLGDSGKLNQTWFPYVAETEAMDLPDSLKDELKNEVILPLRVAKPVGGVLVGLGVILEVLIVYCTCIRKTDDDETNNKDQNKKFVHEVNRDSGYGSAYQEANY